MRKATKLGIATPKPEPQAARGACLVHIYPTGPEMGSRYTLSEVSLILGRDLAADITINNAFVSRQHARIQPDAEGFQVIDLNSTNGTFVNEVRVNTQRLKDGDSLRIGNCIFRFLSGSNLETHYHEEIHRLTIIDALTGIYNHRYLLEFLDNEILRTTRYGTPLSLVLFDLDHFKSINDQLGHLGGDYTLRELAKCIQDSIRKDDMFARYGGEEFVVVMPQTTVEDAAKTAERFRQAVADYPFCFEDKPYQVTISLGVSGTAGDQVLTATELLSQADERMYQAKNTGRNRVVA